ncbi:MAG: NAD-dependent epimerase/dehydratase family protein, partial [Firmicutes bacterium]|nr:NAD-dependent epimerase/dehydratase family protein [Bacillota bacterium]
MNILVTGSAGFVGRNLVENLKNIRDGKNRTRPDLFLEEIYEYDLGSTPEQLDEYCSKADFVFNLAGVNRPKDPAEFKAGNFGFASTLLDTLKKNSNKCPVMLSSSVQATLAGRFGTSEYGLSKRDGEELFFSYATETGSPVYVYRFPNLVGKWVRPNYNSAVGTFCNNIANDLPITINDPSVELEMLFIEDLIEEMYDALERHPHRAEYPKTGEVIDGIEYDGVTAQPVAAGRYCYAPVTHKATLGRIVELLHTFHDQPKTLVMPAIPEGSFEKKLYSMYLSY